MWKLPKLRAGDLVEVRSREEILATLDAGGRIEGMPLMPEMLKYCGRRLKVAAIAHKTCDTAQRTGGRKLNRMVHLLGARCDGSAHGGCEADCNLFWREEWLKPVSTAREEATPSPAARAAAGCDEARLHALTRVQDRGDEPVYACQATELYAASRPLAWWDVRQYVRDVRTGNHSIGTAIRIICLAAARQLTRLPIGYRLSRAIYEYIHRCMTGRPAPEVQGVIPPDEPTPCTKLDLEPGEVVRVRPAGAIAATLNVNNKNRGMWFDREQLPFCGGTYRVQRRVTRIIDERTGRMLAMRSPCITLEGVECPAHYSTGRLLCPRAIKSYWREDWLERVAPPDTHHGRPRAGG
jgi:hypothetical protein